MILSDIRRVLQERGLRPLKQFGQHFLHDAQLCSWAVREIMKDHQPGQRIVEIGPGLGAITGGLLEQGVAVLAIEKDRGLAEYLREHYAGKSLEIVEGDALDHIPPDTLPVPMLVGNLPYNITTPLLMEWAAIAAPPETLFFLVQRETADRLAAKPQTSNYGAVSVTLQSLYQVEFLKPVPGSVFYPPPDVASAFIRLRKKSTTMFQDGTFKNFADFVRQGFSQRRKKLRNVLPVEDDRRPENLAVEEWRELWLRLRHDYKREPSKR